MERTDTHRVVFRQKTGTYEVRKITNYQRVHWYKITLIFSGSEEDCIAYAESLNKKLINT